jgi:hypothetical protein
MTPAPRPTRSERNAIKNQSLKERRVKRITVAKRWTFKIAVQEVVHRGFTPHNDAEKYWTQQSAQPRKRKMLMADGNYHMISNILGGSVSPAPLTTAQKEVIKAKKQATRLANGSNMQQNYKEAVAIKALMKLMDEENEQYDWQAVPDGLAADVSVRLRGTELWAPVQIKSAIVHDDEQASYHVKQTDADATGRYPNMIIVAVGLSPMKQKPCYVFDYVQDTAIVEVLVYADASDIPTSILKPYPRKKTNDMYGDARYVTGFDSTERLEILKENFMNAVLTRAAYTTHDIWFGAQLNRHIAVNHRQEVLNLKILSDVLGIENFRAPLRQNECTDIILTAKDKEINISLKTATKHSKRGYQIALKKAPNAKFCDIVLMFYRDGRDDIRTHVSVVPASRVYAELLVAGYVKLHHPSFGWSPTLNSDILQNRLCLTDPDIHHHLLQAIINTQQST